MRSSMDQLRHIARRLRRAPMFTGVTLLTLAVGIGANTAIFSVISGVLLKPLPYHEPERLVGVWHTAPGLGFDVLNISPSMYFTYREAGRVFEDVAIWQNGSATVTGLAEPERVEELDFTFTMFPLLRAQPALGRVFNSADDQPGSPQTVILSHGYWQRRFGGSPSAIGRRLMVDGEAREIIGVMRPDFRFLDEDAELFVPLRLDRAKVFVGNFSYKGIARLRPGATLAQANADVARMIPMTMDRFPMPPGFTRRMFEETRLGPNVRPLKNEVVEDAGKVLWVLMGTVGIVLLIACANVANLFLVRAEGRQRELAVRAALGAGWGRLARELLAESVGLGILGGALGLGLAYAGLRLLVYLEPAHLPRLSEIAIDGPVLLFTLAISLLAGVLFGLIPVFKYAGRNLAPALKEGGRVSSEGRTRHRARNALVVSQIALALVLLVCAGLMIRTFQALRHVNPGFVRPEEVLTLRISTPESQVGKPEQVARTHQQILERIRRIPEVTAVGVTSSITMDGWDSNDPVFVEERPTPEGQIPAIRRYKWTVPGYFATMGNPLLAGRDFTWNDVYAEPTVVALSAGLARQYWKTPGEALGKRVRESPKSPWRTVIGVVGDERDNGVAKKATETIYWPLVVKRFWDRDEFVARSVAYAIRSPRAGTKAFLNEVRQAVWSVNSNLPLARVRALQRIYERSMERTSFTLVMLGIAGAMALLLGLVGIYGVIAYSVSQRTREIGIRMALGAGRQDVRRMFLGHGLRLTAIGIAAGAAAAAALTRGMSALLFGVNPIDPATYAAVAIVLAGAALAASYLPARRATGIDPSSALRME